MVKRLSTMRETRVWSLGWEDPLEKEMAIHSSTIAWKIPWTEEPGRLQSMGSQRVGQDWATSRSHSVPSLLSLKPMQPHSKMSSYMLLIVFLLMNVLENIKNVCFQMCFKIVSASFKIRNSIGVFIWIAWNYNFNCNLYIVGFLTRNIEWILNFKNVTK